MIKAEYIDHMGTDLTVANAAWVSTAKRGHWALDVDEAKWLRRWFGEDFLGSPLYFEFVAKTRGRILPDRAFGLINYLARNFHFTPFTHCHVTLHCEAPIFVIRQALRSKVGFNPTELDEMEPVLDDFARFWAQLEEAAEPIELNEVSRRYVADPPRFFTPPTLRRRAESVKQGSSDEPIDDEEGVKRVLDQYARSAGALYEDLVASGMAPELARAYLLQGTMTEWYWTGSLAAWARFYLLRIDAHAQREVQELARQVGAIVEPLYPVSWRALTTGGKA